jgi:tetratricopeptide (TPR) repeat protein
MRWRLALYLLRKPREPGGSSSLLDEADSLLKASLADAEATPFDFFYARRNNAVVTARTMMAELFRVRGDEAGARRAELDLQFYKIDLERRRSELRPDQPHWRVQYAESVAMKGHILLRHGDLENAIKSFREAVALYDAVGSSISQPDSLRNRASLNLTLADLLATSAPAEALALFRNAVDLYEQVAALRPKDIRSLTDLAEACGQLRSQCRKRKDAKGAGEAHRKRLAALERLDEISPEDPLARPLQSASLAVDQATVHLQRLEVEAARQSLDLTVKLDQIEPSLESADEVAGACMALARLLNPSSPVDRDEFIKVLKLGRDRLRQLQAEGPLHPVHLRMIDRFEAAIARAMKPSL